ncbi:putative glycine dehydrogenase (decarboxylating) subunit 1 [bioreactor metagenome]|uniref:glycine dehydrogenase (aminomethyl-transferring) n=1 Tax=bioreactor metagenome TaxID=1076179 RepID=A0A645A5G7_9ZZZZ
MPFIPNTDTDRNKMLERIGVKTFDELIEAIPQVVKLTSDLNLPPALSEYEVVKLMKKYANSNISIETHACFIGGGAYDHFTPSIVGSIIERPEFKTSYTPYQAEVSQGTLQAIYEYQSMICQLTGMDMSNASLYDGGMAFAEAAALAHKKTNRKEIILAGTINPNLIETSKTINDGDNLTYKHIISDDGTCDLTALSNSITDNTAAVFVQQPNFLGNIEDVIEIEKIVHAHKILFVIIVNPITLGVLEAPVNYNADIVIGEGQSLGLPLNFGGPYLCIFACKNELSRMLPGRIVGVTQDIEGKRGFVLTLQTREQHIRREKATSNICTNQGLYMLAATVYMATMGKEGIREVAEQSMQKAHYLAENIAKIPGFKINDTKPFFNEFLVETEFSHSDIIAKGIEKGLLVGLCTCKFEGVKSGILVAVTEKRTKEEMDALVDFLKNYK